MFTAFTVWTGLSVLWSYGPDLTWVAFDLTAFYLAAAAVLGLTSVRGLQLRTVGYGYLAVAAAVGAYAFLGKALPDVVTHAHLYARLDSPVGYWNVLALMMVMGLCVALAVAGDRVTPAWLRTLAAAAAVPMGLAFFFTFSRGGWLALGLALVLYFVFTTTRLASLVSLAAIVTPAALVLWRLRGLETLFAQTTDDALRTLQGHTLLRWAVRRPRGHRRRAAGGGPGAGGGALAALVQPGRRGGGARRRRRGRDRRPLDLPAAHGGVPWVKDKAHALLTDAESEGGGNGGGAPVHGDDQRSHPALA